MHFKHLILNLTLSAKRQQTGPGICPASSPSSVDQKPVLSVTQHHAHTKLPVLSKTKQLTPETMSCRCCGPDKPIEAQDSLPVKGHFIVNPNSGSGAPTAQQAAAAEELRDCGDCCAAPPGILEPAETVCQDDCCDGDSDNSSKKGSGDCRDDSNSNCCKAEATTLMDACDKGCCEESAQKCAEQKSVEITSDTGECETGCCGGTLAASASLCCEKPADERSTCSAGANDCCGGSVTSEPAGKADCCNDTSSSRNTFKDAAAAITANGTDSSVMDCCRGKPSPCCDESCLDRLALRECTEGSCCGKPAQCKSAGKLPQGRSRKPCEEHRQSVRQQYAARLAALGCICRALLALGKESCCESTPKPSAHKRRSSKRSSKESFGRSSSVSCSSLSSEDSIRQIKRQRQTGCGAATSEKRPNSGCAGDSCCTPKKPAASETRPKADCASDFCCAPKKPSASEKTTNVDCAGDSCCAPQKSEAGTGKTEFMTTMRNVEAQCEGTEHIVLSISGMTCTGCETKLNRTLANVSGVTNLKTSLVLSRAEFDIDLARVSIDHVMKHLERTTEFKCEVISNKGASLDVAVQGSPSRLLDGTWPDGVIDISLISKDTVRVSFDPEIVGARDLLEKHWDGITTLAPLCADPALAAGSKYVRHVGYTTILSAVLTIPVLVMAWAPLPAREIAYGSASLALATLVQVVIAGPFYPKALKALVFSRVIEMDLLIVLSTSAAYIFSVVSFGYLVTKQPLSSGEFFETSTLLVTLIMVGRYVAALARQRAVESISIRSLQARTALLVDLAQGSNAVEIDARLLQFGDCFKVLPDSRIPTDGTVLHGSSEVNESMLTGESLPVAKFPRSRVMAGTINGSGTLTVQLNRLPGDNTITTIADMVDQAKLSKPGMQELADKVASYFVPVVVALTIVTFATWVGVGIGVQNKTPSDALVQSITYAITVLIVSCPCAIGLAVPMVVVIASGIAAERGVIFKSASAIETAYKTSHVVLDKTGTLTNGQLAVVSQMDEVDVADSSALSLLLGLVEENKHPVSVAVSNHLKNQGIITKAVNDVQNVTGKGVQGKSGKRLLRAGNCRWLGVADHDAVRPLLAQQYTVFCFSIDEKLVAVFALEDSLRPDAARVVHELQKKNISIHIVSGDDDGPVRSVAAKIGVPASNIRSCSSPADKQVYVNTLLGQNEDKNKPVVVFCGDGTNDAVALAQATIGVHMNEGSDVAQSAADVVLMRPELSGLLSMIRASKVSVRRIQFNFGWSFVYNTFAVLLAAGAFVHARIPPEFAGLGELVSVLPVIAAAVLLRWSNI
ncbi:hypothetical protein PWT90_06579 [Aphanocladium album]|nr:hypothetical protein PWT90_06579 [Aphanocladium album]